MNLNGIGGRKFCVFSDFRISKVFVQVSAG